MGASESPGCQPITSWANRWWRQAYVV